MKITVLGCSGGIGGDALRTTSLLIDDDILIDAGTGAADLSLAALAAINHVFITHAHLDHIATLPLLIDATADLRTHPLTVYASAATLKVLQKHIFNWAIWPDFSAIPSPAQAVMRYQTIHLAQTTRLGTRCITALPAEHTVPAVGYQLDSGEASLVFTGDTTINPRFWPIVNQITNLRYLIIETAFSNREQALAALSKHLCPSMLAAELGHLTRPAEIFITHLKPGQDRLTMAEIAACLSQRQAKMLHNKQIFEL
ncbi:MAG: 3',5'-cyclic-nucleotide phosphodiesterase [Pseudomonadota bacterium]